MKLNSIYKILLGGLLAMTACKPEVHTPTPTAGKADFSKYIAVGDSQTAGYADGGLYLAGQENSFPAIIAGQLKAVGGGPLISLCFQQVMKMVRDISP